MEAACRNGLATIQKRNRKHQTLRRYHRPVESFRFGLSRLGRSSTASVHRGSQVANSLRTASRICRYARLSAEGVWAEVQAATTRMESVDSCCCDGGHQGSP